MSDAGEYYERKRLEAELWQRKIAMYERERQRCEAQEPDATEWRAHLDREIALFRKFFERARYAGYWETEA